MALTAASMKTAIKTELKKCSFVADNADLEAFCAAIAKGVVDTITADAAVVVPVSAFTSTPAAVGSPVTAPIAPVTLTIT